MSLFAIPLVISQGARTRTVAIIVPNASIYTERLDVTSAASTTEVPSNPAAFVLAIPRTIKATAKRTASSFFIKKKLHK